ncbi:MAG: radical SAM protein [Brevinematales bacterium]|nr:radical SAM protein [Brevinematales bacterium]
MRFAIIDGYVDEPTCLGVPFFVSTYIRYCAGALVSAGITDIRYRTIEQVRESQYAMQDIDYAVIIAGNPVPGKYLGGMPIKEYEFDKIAAANKKTRFISGGPILLDPLPLHTDNISYAEGDIEKYLYLTFGGGNGGSTRAIADLNRFATAGAFIVEQHPRYPDIICEIETGRGCPRADHCSFCIEGTYPVDFREPGDVVAEMKELERYGIRHFRLGKQADFYTYGCDMSSMKDGFPKPDPGIIQRLYLGIKDSLSSLETLHLDNVNPGTIARYPMESERITRIIAENNTPGDVAALGMESADPKVIALNGLKASAEQVSFAVGMINGIGGIRADGIPKFLPGINLIQGLSGEGKGTFALNYEFLKSLLDHGMMLRRINIRQLRMSRSTEIYSKKSDKKAEKILDAVFRNYREKIRTEIDIPMLKKVYPAGTLLRNVIVEQHRGPWSLARPLGTYPIVIDIPRELPLFSKHDIFVTDHRERSLIGLTFPFIPEKASLNEWKAIPGIGRNAGAVIAGRLFSAQSLSGYDIPPDVFARLFPESF